MKKRSWQLFSVALVGGVVACSSSKNDGGGNGGGASGTGADGSATLADHASVLPAAQTGDVVVASDHLEFPAATHPDMLQRQVGDVLIGDKGGAQNPYGFLRKVAGAPTQSGGTILVPTTKATLLDAVKQAKFQATLQTPGLTMTGPATSAFGVHPQGGVQGGTTIKLLDYSGTKLYDGSGNVTLPSGHTFGYAAHATITTGTLNFSPSWDVGADIEPNLSDPLSSLKEVHAIGQGQLDADLELDLGMQMTGNMNGDDLAQLIAQKVLQAPSKTLADYPIDLGSISLGLFSIPIHAEFKAVLSCNLSYGGGLGVTGGGKASAMVKAGFEYQNQQFTPVFDHNESFTMVGPNWTMDSAAHVFCNVKPEFDLAFWDVASGSVWADAHVTLDAAAECSATKLTGNVSGDAQAGVDAAAQAKVDVFGLYKWDKECTLFDVESPQASFSGSFSLPGGTTTTCTSNPPPANPVQDGPPASCFGDGSGGGGGDDGGTTNPNPTGDDGGTTSSGDGGTGQVVDGCVPLSDHQPPSGWTCDPSRYGDCVCDCDCGGTDVDCVPGTCAGCDHDACTIGDALGSTCKQDNQGGACIAAICANDSYCCTFSWSASCVQHIKNGDYGCTPSDCP
jgi:hypothetical protein